MPKANESVPSFEEIAERKGYSPEKIKRKEKNHKDVSHFLKAKGKDGKPLILRFEVKPQKNKKRDQDWLWIEFRNARGSPGWIHGQSHFIAFEREKDFIILNRKELLSWIGSCGKIRYDLPFVGLAKLAKYRIYRRKGHKEEITQINLEDLSKLKSLQIWEK
tara:strand:- start:44 stop:529 length:486 start_codon:yes stop_codon:yes gene_type:complete